MGCMDDRGVRYLGVTVAVWMLFATWSVARAFEVTPATDDAFDAGQTLTVDREAVTLTFVSVSAGWNDAVSWDGALPGDGFHCHDVAPGFTTPIGRFDGPAEVKLSLTTPDGDTWSTGAGAGNADHTAHARLTVMPPDAVLVEWEDMPAGGDRDYNDCVFILSIADLTR